ncbi:hypothetical protein IFM89_013381 [Coptis chinensis]|uniref:Helicase MAGATAMA 3 n=1 Tax=Coptis chinensis TaxID=261450 RepID=A0A835LXY9_9MAGN|nr:hypothetical protein IFM89_013381 [Coptis chinensis]
MAGEKNKDANALTRFHKVVLSWDYFQLLKDSEQRAKEWKSKKNGAALGLKEVKNTYSDVDDYIATFEPLLFEEVKAQIVQGRDEDNVTVWKLGAVITLSESDGFHVPVVVYNSEEGEIIAENDLLLLSSENLQEGKGLPSGYAFALVLNREGKDRLKLRTFLSGEVSLMNLDKIKSCPRLLNMHSIFTASDVSQRRVWILKIASLSTIVREYVGLWSITSLPFKELILSADEKDSGSEDRSWTIARPLMEILENDHNTSQMDAIHVGLSRKTFVLIQGPPGTGKTQTILGLLSAILHSTPVRGKSKGGLRDKRLVRELDIHEKYNHWKLASPWLYDINPRDKIMPIDGDDGFFPTSGNELKPEIVNSNRKYRVRVLVCAPSNSALDEIVLRVLSKGIHDENGNVDKPKIVRIGLKPHHSVQAVSMDYQVEQKLSGMDNTTADARKRGATGDRDSIRASVLDEAAIVFSTLSFSGSSLFSKLNHVFDVVIIDEAAQAVEPATLVPLANGCKQVFLVGDPVQLPATVISPIAERFGYGMSLFKRLQKAGYPVQMLKTQYRMHPEIRYFPSREFYSEALEDGPDVKDQTERPWHGYHCFGPFVFFDITEGVESQPSGSGSWVNVDEVEFILLMYNKLVTNYPELKSSSRLAIISPYRHQVKLFRDRFRDTFGVESDKLVDINTVDGFQSVNIVVTMLEKTIFIKLLEPRDGGGGGSHKNVWFAIDVNPTVGFAPGREKDVAIFSCVRASKDKGIGFVADFRRMNVGITRARSSVLVVGSASTLKRDKHWANLVQSAEQRSCLFKVSRPYTSFFNDKNLKTLQVKDETMIDAVENHPGETEDNAAMYGNPVGEPEQGQVDDDDYGDGEDAGFGED